MRKVFVASAIALMSVAAVPAKAMPLAPLGHANSGVTHVAFGCGPGWTRGPYGHCRPMGYYAAPVAPVLPVVGAPVLPVYGAPYYGYGHRCWWRAGVRVCN
jgi:hypothetical protein